MSKYEIGQIVTCCVTGIEKYGIFVNLEEYYSGLIHISEISSQFVRNINDYVDEVIKPIKERLEAIDNANPSKALECLEKLANHYDNEKQMYYNETEDYNTIKQALITKPKNVDKWHEVIEQAIQRLEVIENAKSSEALKIVDKMANYILLDEKYGFIDDEEKQTIIEDRDTIKQALIQAQEQEKVLEIIFEKNVDIYLLKDARNLEEYNRWISQRGRHYYRPTQEEFDLLKRGLE